MLNFLPNFLKLLLINIFVASSSFAYTDKIDPPSYYIVAIPSKFSPIMAEEFHKNFSKLLYKLKEGDVVEILNGKTYEKVASVTIPNGISESDSGKKRFFDRHLKGYINFIKVTDNIPKQDINIRGIIEYAHEMQNVKKEKFPNIKVIMYGNVFPTINAPNNLDKNNYLNYSLEEYGSIYEDSSNRLFGTKDRRHFMKSIFVFLFLPEDTTPGQNGQKQKAEKFLSTYTCNQSGKIKISSNLGLLDSVIAEKGDSVDHANECAFANNKVSELNPKVADAIPAKEMFGSTIIQNPPFPNSQYGYVKVGLRWDYNACKNKDTDCDLDLYISPSKFDSEISFKSQESSTFGWYKKLDMNNKNNSYEIIDLARNPVNIDDSVVYVNFFSGKAPKGMDIELRVVFNDQVYRKEIHINATTGNRGKEPRTEPNWIKINLGDLLKDESIKDNKTKH